MASEVTLPALGESVTEGTVTRWLKQVGDAVAVDEPLLEVSTDKVDTEIPSPVAGKLLEIKVNEDETVEVGAVLALVGAEGASTGSSGAGDTGAQESPQPEPQPEPERQPEPEPAPAADRVRAGGRSTTDARHVDAPLRRQRLRPPHLRGGRGGTRRHGRPGQLSAGTPGLADRSSRGASVGGLSRFKVQGSRFKVQGSRFK